MNQSDRTLAYHHHTIELLLGRFKGSPSPTDLRSGAQAPVVEYDPNQQAERVELRCPVCGRRRCPLDVRRGM